MAKRRRGRQLKLNNAVIEAISDAISIGASYRIAAGYAKVSYRAFLNWMDEGEAEVKRLEAAEEAGEEVKPDPSKKLFVKLFNAVYEASMDAGVRWLQVLDRAADVDPRWAKYMLETRFPEDFGQQPIRHEVTGKDGQPIQTEDVSLDNEARIQKLAAILARAQRRKEEAEQTGDDEA